MSSAEFIAFVKAHPLDSLDDTFISGDASKAKIRGRFAGMQLERIPFYRSYDSQAYSERTFFGGLVDILHPYSVLRLLAEVNENAPVVWQYGPLVEAGWATTREFVPYAGRTETFLIATEGSSDVHILKHALSLLRPGIARGLLPLYRCEREPSILGNRHSGEVRGRAGEDRCPESSGLRVR
jgi:HEPN/Toprim N-terminal domain 1